MVLTDRRQSWHYLPVSDTNTTTGDTTMNTTMNPETTIRQIGRGNVLAISGGRVEVRYAGTYRSVSRHVQAIILPVRYGYAVQITLAANDTYSVARTFTRSGVTTVKAVREGVYADQLGDVAYRASCYRDEF